MNYLIIELQGNEAVFARLWVNRGRLLVQSAIRRPAAGHEEFGAALREAAAQSPAGTTVVLALAPTEVFCRELELPLTDRRKLREVLPIELKGETALDTDDLVFDALPLGNGRVLALWTRKARLASMVKTMAEAGLEPRIVSASLFHWHHLLPSASNGQWTAVADSFGLAVFNNRQPFCFRPLDRTAAAANLTDTLAAVECSQGIAIPHVFLHGDARPDANGWDNPAKGSTLPLGDDLSAAFPGDSAAALEYAGIYALAKACLRGEVVNFRQGALAYTADRLQTRKKFHLTALLAALLVLILFADAGIRYFMVKRDLDSLNASIHAIYHEVFPTRKKAVDEVAELKTEITRLGGTGGGSSNVLRALKHLAETKPDDVTGIYEAEIEGRQLRLKGEARSIQAAGDFKARAAALFENAEIGETKSRPAGGVSFVLRGTLREGAK